MSVRMRRPETVKLDISCGDWLLVKKHLTAGETMDLFSRMLRRNGGGPEIDPVLTGLSKLTTYLLDWSITDQDDKPVVIRDQPPDVVMAALKALDSAAYREILAAVEAHEDAVAAELGQEKNVQAGGIGSSAISPLPS